MELTAYQTQFREKLSEEFKQQFDQVAELAKGELDAFVKALPPAFAPYLKGVTTAEGTLDVVLKNTDWGGVEYAPPKPAVTKKALAVSPAAKASVNPGEAGAAGVATKHRGNPEALKKAREARGTKSAEEMEKDRVVVMDAMVAHLKASTGPQGIKPAIAALVEALKGKSVKGTDLPESFIYSTITAAIKDVDKCPIKFTEMEGKKKGYALK
jgi:hypothetical protein